MNICLVSANYWPGWGGAEGQCRLLAGELHRRGHEVVVLTRARPDAPAEERVDGVSVRRTAAFGRGAVRSLVWTLTAAAWLRRAGRRLQVVQCFQLLSPSHVGVLGRGRSGKQAVLLRPACSGPFGDVAEVRRLPLTRLRQRLLRQADACVTLTRDIEVELAALGLATLPFHRVPNAVDLTLFRPATAEERRRIRVRLGLPEDRVVCVYLGRLVPQKDPELLLDAWFRVARPDAHLALVGDGPLRPRL
ncbi:MAG TPA: glycosyltransferase family 4 protein, partial [Candidatus Acidoferrum sp.]|nr:glycosyltransferase family 4 protein [Candidatus Acidoferrum sp.]